MRNILFLTIMLFGTATATVNAQITIGANDAPHQGAALDLREERGLLLSKAYLNNAHTFQLAGIGEAEAEGMIIYNTNPGIINGQGEGVYLWDGSRWMYVIEGNQSQSVATKKITISLIPNNNSVISGNTVQLQVDVTPASLPDKSYRWFVISNPGTGIIDANNVFTGNIPGNVRVRAMLADGSGTFDEVTITVLPNNPVTQITVSGPSSVYVGETVNLTANVTPSNANRTVTWTMIAGDAAAVDPNTGSVTGIKPGNITVMASANDGSGVSATYAVSVSAVNGLIKVQHYDVFCYPDHLGCWMIENSKEHAQSAFQTSYTGKADGERGYYYIPGNIYNEVICPYGFRVPSDQEWAALINYLEKSTTPASQKASWNSGEALAGEYTVVGKKADKWDAAGYWWTNSGKFVYYTTTNSLNKFFGPVSETDERRAYSIRCIRKN